MSRACLMSVILSPGCLSYVTVSMLNLVGTMGDQQTFKDVAYYLDRWGLNQRISGSV